MEAIQSLLTVKEVSIRLGMSERTVGKLACENVIPSVKIGGSRRFSSESIDRWIVALETDSKATSNCEGGQNDE